MRNAGRLIPSSRSSASPASAKSSSTPPAIATPRRATACFPPVSSPRVSATKIGRLPSGSITTKRLVKAVRATSSTARIVPPGGSFRAPFRRARRSRLGCPAVPRAFPIHCLLPALLAGCAGVALAPAPTAGEIDAVAAGLLDGIDEPADDAGWRIGDAVLLSIRIEQPDACR